MLKAVRGKLRQHLKKVAEHTKTVRRWEARKKKEKGGKKAPFSTINKETRRR